MMSWIRNVSVWLLIVSSLDNSIVLFDLTLLVIHCLKYSIPKHIKYIFHIKSSDGVRLYELLLRQIEFGKECECEIHEFCSLLGLDGQYTQIQDLKARVINCGWRMFIKIQTLKFNSGKRNVGELSLIFNLRSDTRMPQKKILVNYFYQKSKVTRCVSRRIVWRI